MVMELPSNACPPPQSRGHGCASTDSETDRGRTVWPTHRVSFVLPTRLRPRNLALWHVTGRREGSRSARPVRGRP